MESGWAGKKEWKVESGWVGKKKEERKVDGVLEVCFGYMERRLEEKKTLWL